MQAEVCEDFGLDGEHGFEELGCGGEGGSGPAEHFYFCEFVDAVEALGVDAASASFGAVAAAGADDAKGEGRAGDIGGCMEGSEGYFCRAG